jgi:hypothetical protein
VRRYAGRITAWFYPERCGLWQPNNNSGYSAVDRGANRLTLPANWGQITPVDRDFCIFRAGASAVGNGLHARLTAALASMENQNR